MSRPRWAVVPVAAAVGLVLATQPAIARVIGNTIGPTATLVGEGHAAVGEVLIACTQGEQVRFTLTLTQGSTSGTGQGAGRCTGELVAYPVTVAAEAGAFTEGPAEACATALNTHRGVVQDSQQWCRAVGVTLHEG